MEKCKRMKGAIVYVKELDLFLTMKVLDKTPAVLSFGKLCDENGYSYGWINGQKPHFNKDGIRTICNTENFVFIVVPGLSSLSSGCSSILQTSMRQESHSPLFFFVFFIYSKWNSDSRTIGSNWEWHLSSNCVKYGQTDPILTKPWKSQTIKKGTQEGTGRPVVCRFRSGKFWSPGVAARIQRKFGGWRNSRTWRLSRQFFSWSIFRAHTQETWGFVYTKCLYSFPVRPKLWDLSEDEITRALCRRRNGRAVFRVENFGDQITADHKVLSDNRESRNNHWCAVVVQDLAKQWIQAYPCKNKTSQETQRSWQTFLESNRKPKVIYIDNYLEFGDACEDLSLGIIARLLHTDRSFMVLKKELCVEWKTVPLLYCCNQV